MKIHAFTATPAGGVARLAALAGLSRYMPRIVFEADNGGGSGGGQKSAADLAREVKASFDKAVDDVKSIAEKALAEAQKGIAQTSGMKEQADELLVKMNGLKEQIGTLEQKAARGGGREEEAKSLGAQFVESEAYKSFAASSPRSGKASLKIKADISTATANAAGSVGAGIAPNRLPGIVELPRRRLTVRNLLAPGRTDSPIVEYVKEVGFTNAAATVAEGAAKPKSDVELSDVQTTTKVIAHFMKATKQALSDVSQLRSYIDSRLLYGLALKEEAQLLNGDGTGSNLLGIVPQATAYAAPLAIPDATSLDMMRLAMLQAVLAEYPATGHVMNPIDWAWIELLKDAEGRHIIGLPQGVATPTLWGLPVVQTQAMAVDKFLTGAFDMAAQVFDQWDATVEAGFENDDFTKNKITILAEERLALAVYRPEAFVYGDFGRVA